MTEFTKSLLNLASAARATLLIAASLAGPLASDVAAETPADYLLRAAPSVGDYRQVVTVVEVQGNLKLNADGQEVTKLPLKVRGDLQYTERILALDSQQASRRDARFYHQAKASMEVGESTRQASLGADEQLIVVDIQAEKTQLFAPRGPLKREELELIATQCNTALLFRLLPGTRVGLSDEWEHADGLVAELFGLDVVHTNSLKSTLRKVERGTAIVDLAGDLNGAVGGVASDLQIKAVYNVNLEEGRVSWFASQIKEDRAVGHAEPGFEVTARIRTASQPRTAIAQLSDQALGDLPLEPNRGSTLLEFHSVAGGFRLLHDRQWRLMVDRYDVSILRRVELGDLVAQCNISSLPDLKPGKRPGMESFQADVKRALADNFGEFVDQSDATTETGLRILRTVVSGFVSELPIQWTYYHFSDDAGRQVSLVFTMSSEFVERFAQSDASIVSSFAFRPRPEPVTAPAGSPDPPARQASNPSDPTLQ